MLNIVLIIILNDIAHPKVPSSFVASFLFFWGGRGKGQGKPTRLFFFTSNGEPHSTLFIPFFLHFASLARNSENLHAFDVWSEVFFYTASDKELLQLFDRRGNEEERESESEKERERARARAKERKKKRKKKDILKSWFLFGYARST